ncbi:MAG: CPBP family intramembrane metalloprotease, partial [Candidatus Caldarchaeum sp.]|nr:CPBP family intramembrane metalloprotease [Candidatus Caldarchaeum sp.]
LGYNYPDNRLLGVLLFTAFTTALSLPHAVLKKLSSSILPASSLHGAVNALWSTTLLMSDLPREIGGLGPVAYLTWTAVSTAMYAGVRYIGAARKQPSLTPSS